MAFTSVYIKGVAEVLHTLDIRNDRLFLVHLKEEFSLDKLGYGRPYTCCSPLGLTEYYRIIGIADKGVTSTCEFLVQLVEHDVAQKWTQRTALLSTLLARVPKTFGYHTAAQIFVYKANHSAILYRTAEYLYEFAVVNCVKEAFEVEVNYICIAIINRLLHFSQCVVASSGRAKAEAPLGKMRLIDLC